MNGRISAALVAVGAMILFVGSASDRAHAQSFSRETELSAANVQDDRRIAGRIMRSKVGSRKTPTTHGATMPGVTIPEEPMTIARGEMTAD